MAEQEKTTILSSTVDNVLQPDAMRGSEQYLKDLNVVDEEQDRRDAVTDTKSTLTPVQNPTPPKTTSTTSSTT